MKTSDDAVTPWLIPLPRATDAGQVGGKAASLARLIAAGAPVPRGFVVAAPAYNAFLAENEVAARLAGRLRGLRAEELAGSAEAARALEALVLATPIPTTLWDSIRALRRALLGEAPVAVRSSAIGEDGAASSFAGQLTSVLGVITDDELAHALRRCWASYRSERVLAYQARRRTALAGMAIVVQELVPARLAGVLFTRAPRSADANDEMLVEYVHGLGEALVSGAADPGRAAISRSTLAVRPSCRPEPTPPDVEHARAEEHFLHGGAGELARLALDLERRFGAPQDLEWAIDAADSLFVVQARPITAGVLPSAGSPPGRTVVYSNANVNENFPAPISPFLYSIASAGYTSYFRNLALALGLAPERVRRMDTHLRHIVGVHGGRLYYNLTNLHAVLRAAPFGEHLVDSFNLFVGAAQRTGQPEVGSRLGVGLRERAAAGLELGRIAASAVHRYRRLEAGVAGFEATVTAFCADCDARLAAGPDADSLLSLLRGFLDLRENRWLGASCADAASMVGYGAVTSLLGTLLPGPEHANVQNDLLRGLGDLVSSAPAVALFELSRRVREQAELADLLEHEAVAERVLGAIRSEPKFAGFAAELDGYLRTWGFRCPGELMLTVPSFEEDPATLLVLLRTYARVESGSPAEALATQNRSRETATRALLARLAQGTLRQRAGAPLLARLLAFTRRAIALRERARLKQSLLYSRCRRIALAIGAWLVAGGRLAAREDVFFFRHDELEALLVGDALFPHHIDEQVALRRRHFAELAATEPTDTVEIAPGACSMPGGLPAASDPDPGARAGDDGLTGTSACGGRATGRAAVLDDVGQAATLRPGDILVTRQADPAWGPVFFLIKGLVLERGGMLSHGAIIAREFGIPAVVGVGRATQRIATGVRITVDGDRGVIVLEPSA